MAQSHSDCPHFGHQSRVPGSQAVALVSDLATSSGVPTTPIQVQQFSRTIHKLRKVLHLWSQARGTGYDSGPGKQEPHRASAGDGGVHGASRPPWGRHPPSTSMCSPTWKLLGFRAFTPYPSREPGVAESRPWGMAPPWKLRGGAESSNPLIRIGWGGRYSGHQPHPHAIRGPSRVASLA